MSLCKRLIARLDIKGNKLIKGVRFEGLRVLGNPVQAASQYARDGIDEILFIDAVASLYGRNSLAEILRETTREVFVPITAGGGVRSVEDAAKLLASGADKIALNTESLKRPELITELAREFGSQCVVASIQARRINSSQWEAMGEAGRERSGRNALAWMQEAQERGAGEILLTSIDQDGTCQGPDHELINQAVTDLSIPLVVCGGFSSQNDISQALQHNRVGGIAIGAAFHKKKIGITSCKNKLEEEKIRMRTIQSETPINDKPLAGHKIGVIDYGMGNQQSLINALQYLGSETLLSEQWDDVKQCDLIMLPGVGAFPEGIKRLQERSLIAPLIDWANTGQPIIGICLGMQMLFERGEEFEITKGLGLLQGTIKKLRPNSQGIIENLVLPHIGWNQLIAQNQSTDELNKIDQYFVHSYAAKDVDHSMILHTSSYGSEQIVASIQNRNICGFQFHPERGGEIGLSLLASTITRLLNT